MDQAWNAATYADGAPELAPPELWPAPYDGYRLRHYPLAQYAKANGGKLSEKEVAKAIDEIEIRAEVKKRLSDELGTLVE